MFEEDARVGFVKLTLTNMVARVNKLTRFPLILFFGTKQACSSLGVRLLKSTHAFFFTYPDINEKSAKRYQFVTKKGYLSN